MKVLDENELRCVCGGLNWETHPFPPLNWKQNEIAQKRKQGREVFLAITKLHHELSESARTHNDQMKTAKMSLLMNAIKKRLG